ncbi:putative RNA-directed DNA polymerase, eukaryota, reverse transcriptase zinc-binding domain protein [Tanacetum coccineum]|uniref:RNA-directed DNA polymerase, eukaryota, reverse transcriptase zinc-binding domain protein n=1 Tax=Tanacetum coccineum TaxID=301880 RepID=A0ABQ5GK73_9ASTR
MIFKVDFEKAFDFVNWNYLYFVLLHMGFGSKWRSWICSCLHSARTSILINGSPTLELSLGHGLRQGDQLSPFLFILVMEGLHLALQEANHSWLIKGVSLGNDAFNVSYFFFANDVVILTDWNTNDMKNIVRTLNSFYMASGLKINISKSNVYGVGVSEENLEAMAILAGCLAGSLPFTYLGLPIGKNMKLTDSWCVIVDKFKSKLSSWKANLLSIGGCLTLIKLVLGSLGIFYFSIFRAPELTFNILERLRARFFWGGHDDQGGLGVGSLKAFNLALLQKWRWRLVNKPELLWVRIIKAIHGMEAGLDEKDSWSWNWRRPITSRRISDLLHNLMHELRHVALSANSDSWTWSIGEDGVFSVAATRLHIDHSILPSSSIETRWNKGLLRKVNIFIWRLRLDRLPTRLNLSKRGLEIDSILCPICNANVESNDHIFFNCEVASSV